MLAVLLSLSVGVSCCWFAYGTSWIYDPVSRTYPILQCPKFMVNTATKGFADGPMCRVTLSNIGLHQEAVIDNDACRSPPITSEDYIQCHLRTPCRKACTLSDTNRFCPDATLLTEPTPSDPGEECDVSLPGSDPFTTSCYYIHWTPFCESTFRVTPGAILAMRSLFAGTGVMVFVWIFAEVTLWLADRKLKHETAQGYTRQQQLLPPVIARLRQILTQRWQIEADQNRGGGPPSAASASWYCPSEAAASFRTSSGPLYSRNPERRFRSSQWNRRLGQWRKLNGQKTALFKTTVLARSLFLSLFFILILICAMFTIISVSPSQIPANADVLSVVEGTIRILPLYTWMDGLIFVDILLDFGLFIVATASVSWPTSPVFATHMKDKLGELEAKLERGAITSYPPRSIHSDNDSVSVDTENSFESVLDQALTNECCLLIACHESCLTVDKEQSFINTLRSALRVFPPNHIFVCDNGSSIQPSDHTQTVTESVHPAINYLYIPEGNKTIAFYWTNRYWVPFLESCGRVPKFTYAVIIDDDVPLPPDLHIPHARLRENKNIKAVHYPITAAVFDAKTPGGIARGGVMVQCQDIEYKLAAVHKYFQSTIARVVSCHGAIALWERTALNEILLQHDCVFNGEDMYMGISLLRRRDSSVIISCPQSIVPTFAPTSWRMLFRQRVKSWEVTSHKKTFTFIIELINPISWFHLKSVALKPYFLQELLSIILDWLRIFLLISLAFRDYLALALMTAVFSFLMYIQVLVFQFVYLRRRKDLRVSTWGIIMFPFYRLSSLLFRVCALCQNILVYSHYRKGVRIQDREDEVKDMPPCPPHPDADWFTVWSPSTNTETNTP